MPRCVNCLANFHTSCLQKSCDCSHNSGQPESDPSPTPREGSAQEELPSEDSDEVEESDLRASSVKRRSGGSRKGIYKRDAILTDQQSTGRKRAARLYPLDRSAPCQWQGYANVGGGEHPIVGCVHGLQEARHHGPDKAVTNNSQGNVHLICHRCHVRWHYANNPTYNWNTTYHPAHDPRPMTVEEKFWAMVDEEKFREEKVKRIKD